MIRVLTNQRIISSILALLSLSGCATFSHKKHAPVAAEGEVQIRPTYVGSVTLVNEELRFVLIEASPLALPEPGQALKCLSNGEESAIVTVSAERHRPFFSADIVKGEPHKGDEVYQ